MRKEYDLKQLKVKRRGVIPQLKAEPSSKKKLRITISLDEDIVSYFKREASEEGALPYQTQINQALRGLLGKQQGGGGAESNLDSFKSELLSDPVFIAALATELGKKDSAGKRS